jgi:hypothetical protein
MVGSAAVSNAPSGSSRPRQVLSKNSKHGRNIVDREFIPIVGQQGYVPAKIRI